MKIKELSKDEMTLIVEVLDQFVSNVKGQKTALEVLEKLRNDLRGGISGLKVTCPPFSIDEYYTTSELTTQEIDKILFVLNDKIEDLRDQIDDEVVAIDATDADESISDIIDNLSSALETAQKVEKLESIRENIATQKNKAEQEENEKDNKIAELRAKVDTQQMALNSKDGEIRSLKSRNNDADRYIDELRYRLERYEPVRGVRGCDCPMCRPRPSFRGMF